MSSITLAPVLQAVPQKKVRCPWIISQREDMIWFIGSALAGYLAVALMWAGSAIGYPNQFLLPIQFVWFFAIDNPHVVATATRTYFDKEERHKLGWLLWIPIPLMLLGPAASLSGHAAIFLLFAFCWQQFHVTKQHFGFMMLYKAKQGERDRTDFKLDRWFLLASLFVPLGLFIIKVEPWAAAIPHVAWIKASAFIGYAALTLVWLARQIQKWQRGDKPNWQKLALLAGVVPLQWIALGFGAQFGPKGILQAAIPLGIFHGLQYHRLMWFHNHNRYSGSEARERNGVAATLATRASRYFLTAVGLNFGLSFLPQALFPYEVVQTAMWGIPFAHYVIDAKIWHIREDKDLATALHMG